MARYGLWGTVVFLGVLASFVSSANAQTDLSFVSPVGHCASRDQFVLWKGNFMVSSGDEATFQCGLDSVLTPPSAITQATVYVRVEFAKRGDEAWARLCFRPVGESLGSGTTCGRQAYIDPRSTPQTISAIPPKELPPGRLVVYLEVHLPKPSPGYHFFNGYRIQS